MCFSISDIIDESLTSCLCWCGCNKNSVIGSLSSWGNFMLFHYWEFHTHSPLQWFSTIPFCFVSLWTMRQRNEGNSMEAALRLHASKSIELLGLGEMNRFHRESTYIPSLSYFGISVLFPKHPCLCPVVVQNGVSQRFYLFAGLIDTKASVQI